MSHARAGSSPVHGTIEIPRVLGPWFFISVKLLTVPEMGVNILSNNQIENFYREQAEGPGPKKPRQPPDMEV